MAGTPKGAEARLTDLDVREVSVVDRPANKRRFLIVKRDDGNLAVIRMEEPMSRTAIPREAAEEFGHILLSDGDDKATILKDDDIADLVGLGEEDGEEEETEAAADGEIVEVEKGVKDEAIKIAKAALQRLMSIVNKLKGASKEKGGKLPAPLSNEVRTLAQALSALAQKLGGKGKGKDTDDAAEKAVSDAVGGLTAAVEKLMEVVNALKALDQAATEVPGEIVTQIQGVATMLAQVASRFGAGEEAPEEGAADAKKKPEKPEAEQAQKIKRPEVFVKRSDDGDPEVIIKAGRKMKRTRLSLFKKAVEMLQEILREIDAAAARADAEEPQRRQTKTEADNDSFQAKLLETLTSIKDEVGKVTKRVSDLEGTHPAGSEEDPPEVVEKKRTGIWGSVFNQ